MHIAQPTGAAGRLILHQQQPATYLGLQKKTPKKQQKPQQQLNTLQLLHWDLWLGKNKSVSHKIVVFGVGAGPLVKVHGVHTQAASRGMCCS